MGAPCGGVPKPFYPKISFLGPNEVLEMHLAPFLCKLCVLEKKTEKLARRFLANYDHLCQPKMTYLEFI